MEEKLKIPREPLFFEIRAITGTFYKYYCSNPNCEYIVTEEMRFCPGCGQEIDWGGYID